MMEGKRGKERMREVGERKRRERGWVTLVCTLAFCPSFPYDRSNETWSSCLGLRKWKLSVEVNKAVPIT